MAYPYQNLLAQELENYCIKAWRSLSERIPPDFWGYSTWISKTPFLVCWSCTWRLVEMLIWNSSGGSLRIVLRLNMLLWDTSLVIHSNNSNDRSDLYIHPYPLVTERVPFQENLTLQFGQNWLPQTLIVKSHSRGTNGDIAIFWLTPKS